MRFSSRPPTLAYLLFPSSSYRFMKSQGCQFGLMRYQILSFAVESNRIDIPEPVKATEVVPFGNTKYEKKVFED